MTYTSTSQNHQTGITIPFLYRTTVQAGSPQLRGKAWGVVPIWFGLQSTCDKANNITEYISTTQATASDQGAEEADQAVAQDSLLGITAGDHLPGHRELHARPQHVQPCSPSIRERICERDWILQWLQCGRLRKPRSYYQRHLAGKSGPSGDLDREG